jgi:nudix-type nucleoside diphosphatase (YffH/AdpP family)
MDVHVAPGNRWRPLSVVEALGGDGLDLAAPGMIYFQSLGIRNTQLVEPRHHGAALDDAVDRNIAHESQNLEIPGFLFYFCFPTEFQWHVGEIQEPRPVKRAKRLFVSYRQGKTSGGGLKSTTWLGTYDGICSEKGSVTLMGNMPDIENRVRLRSLSILSDNHYILRKADFELRRADGQWQEQSRESYDIGDGAAVLPIDRNTGSVLLVRQFRWPAFEHGYRQLMVEVIAGKLDGDDPATCATKEADEEASANIWNLRPIFHCFMSPGAVTERLHLFAADYDSTARRHVTGGNEQEGEDIEVLELPLQTAMEMVKRGEIVDAKTIMLLQWALLHTPTST